MKSHCLQRWWASLTSSESGVVEKVGESTSAWAREVGKGQGVLLEGNQEGIRRRDFEGRGGGGGIGSCEED